MKTKPSPFPSPSRCPRSGYAPPRARAGIFIALLIVAGFSAAAATNAPPTDFTGRWRFDEKASDSMDEMARQQGANWVERRLAASLRPVQTISQAVDRITISIDSGIAVRTETLRLDGQPEEKNTDRAGQVTTRSRWAPDGSLITVAESRKDGAVTLTTMTRSLSPDRSTMTQLIEMKPPSGETLTARRIFRREPESGTVSPAPAAKSP